MFLALLSKKGSAVTFLPISLRAREKAPIASPQTIFGQGGAIDMMTSLRPHPGPITAARNHHVIPT